MKRIRKKQLLFLGGNIAMLLALFIALGVYDSRFREAPVLYERPLVEMEKIRPSENPYFDNFDRMELFSRYRGTRAVGSVDPERMVLLVTPGRYDRYLHFSHLLYEAYRRKTGLVLLDFADIRHFVPLKEGEGPLGSSERIVFFVRTMIAYMEQYGFSDFRVVYLGLNPPDYLRDALEPLEVFRIGADPPSDGSSFPIEEEVAIIDRVLSFEERG